MKLSGKYALVTFVTFFFFSALLISSFSYQTKKKIKMENSGIIDQYLNKDYHYPSIVLLSAGSLHWSLNDGISVGHSNLTIVPFSDNRQAVLFLNPNPIPSNRVGIPERPVTLTVVNASLAIRVVPIDSIRTCPSFNGAYDSRIKDVTLVPAGLSINEFQPTRLCIKLSEIEYLDMIFSNSIYDFDWIYSKTEYQYSLDSSTIVLNGLQNNTIIATGKLNESENIAFRNYFEGELKNLIDNSSRLDSIGAFYWSINGESVSVRIDYPMNYSDDEKAAILNNLLTKIEGKWYVKKVELSRKGSFT